MGIGSSVTKLNLLYKATYYDHFSRAGLYIPKHGLQLIKRYNYILLSNTIKLNQKIVGFVKNPIKDTNICTRINFKSKTTFKCFRHYNNISKEKINCRSTQTKFRFVISVFIVAPTSTILRWSIKLYIHP